MIHGFYDVYNIILITNMLGGQIFESLIMDIVVQNLS